MGAQFDADTLWSEFLDDYQKDAERESQSSDKKSENSGNGSSDEQSGKKIITLLMSLWVETA